MQERVAGRERVPQDQLDRRHVADHDHRLPGVGRPASLVTTAASPALATARNDSPPGGADVG